jgi:hypothetical protein
MRPLEFSSLARAAIRVSVREVRCSLAMEDRVAPLLSHLQLSRLFFALRPPQNFILPGGTGVHCVQRTRNGIGNRGAIVMGDAMRAQSRAFAADASCAR